MSYLQRQYRTLLVSVLVLSTAACCPSKPARAAAVAFTAKDVARAAAKQSDPTVVRAGTPAYLMLLDGLIEASPDNARLLVAGCQAYSAYASLFTAEADQARTSALCARYLINTSYVTFDGVAITGPTTLTIHTLQNAAYVFNDALDFINNSDHDIIQNITFIVDDITRASGSGFWFTQTGSAPDSNLIQNNFVKKAGDPFFIVSASASLKGKGNVIRGNQIGSETDSLISLGIEVAKCENAIVENNTVQNLKVNMSGAERILTGVLATMSSGTIIRNNICRNFRAISGHGGQAGRSL